VRRTRFTAAALAGVLAIGTATAVAAPAKHFAAKPTCGLKLTEQIPNGETAVNPADTQGSHVGTVACGKLLGTGLAWTAFTVSASGDLVGTFKQYFATGSLRGKFDLVPDDSNPPGTTTFAASSYTGTLTVTGGTGVYQAAKGAGKITCRSADSIHLSCTEHLKLTRL
jgi:hypothetical protein